MLWVIYLIVASLPALGIVYLFGGVPLSTVGAALVVTLSTRARLLRTRSRAERDLSTHSCRHRAGIRRRAGDDDRAADPRRVARGDRRLQ